MKQDGVREAEKSLQDALTLLSEAEAKPVAWENLKAALERASKALKSPPPREEQQRSVFAPPPRTNGELLSSFVEGMATIVIALALTLILLVLAFGKTGAPPSTFACCQLKCCPIQTEQAQRKEGCNG